MLAHRLRRWHNIKPTLLPEITTDYISWDPLGKNPPDNMLKTSCCNHMDAVSQRPNADPMLVHRLRRRPNNSPASGQGIVFAGLDHEDSCC